MKLTVDLVGVGLTIGSAAFATLALARPDVLSGEPTSDGQRYYAQMYAARALPLAGLLLRRRSPELLITAAAAQFGDAAIGASRGNLRQTLPTLFAGTIYAMQALSSRG